MTDARTQELTLEIITRAAQVMAGQNSVEGVATALLNASLTISGATRGIVALSSSGPLIAEGKDPVLSSVDMVKARPAVASERLSKDVWADAVRERAPQMRFNQDRPTAFRGTNRTPRVSTLCIPVIVGDAVCGFLYLEFDYGADGIANGRVATTALLVSQAAMTMEAIRAFETQTNVPLWQSRIQVTGRVATFRWNPEVRIAEGGPELYALLGLDPRVGPIGFATLTSLVHPADYPRAQATVDDVVRRRAPLKLEWRLLRETGEMRDLLWIGQFNAADPRDPWIEGVVMDVTDQKAADGALRIAQEEAERHVRLAWLGELSGSIVHEVAQPLGAVISSAEAAKRWLAKDPPDVNAALKSIERIRDAAFAATRTVTGMRALSASVPMEFVERSLNTIVSEALQLSKPALSRAGVRVEVLLDPGHPTVRGDPNQLLQVLLNLIRNAMDSLQNVDGRERTLVVRTSLEGGQIRLELEDSGVGLSDDVAERLFNALFTTKTDGMGLGLSICRRIVVAHRGSIIARRNPGFGAKFIVTLPHSVTDW